MRHLWEIKAQGNNYFKEIDGSYVYSFSKEGNS